MLLRKGQIRAEKEKSNAKHCPKKFGHFGFLTIGN
jgi:hypothetical protein